MFRDKHGSQPLEREYPFWDHPEQWPHDPPGYVFLARGCHEVGRALFFEQWSESWGEPAEPPDECDPPTWKQYERECGEFQKAFVAMRSEVVRRISGQCEAGTLVAAVRPKAGGEMVRLEQHLWNLERVEGRFHRCDMSGDNPLEVGDSYGPDWIFIERGTLDVVLNGLHQSAPLPNAAAFDTSPSTNAFHQPRDHKFLLAKMALLAVYGPNGPDLGETEEDCFHKVNEWLRQNGKHEVSKQTLRRAKRALRTKNQA